MFAKITGGFVYEIFPNNEKYIDRIENISTDKLIAEKNRLQAVLNPPYDIGKLSHEEARNIHDLLEPINYELSTRGNANTTN